MSDAQPPPVPPPSVPPATPPRPSLTTRERLMLGALGALTPQIANLLVVDLESVLSQANLFSAAGYAIRVLALAGVGMFVAYLHDDETNKVKAFQFGMAAPAMLLAAINGSQLATAQGQVGRAEAAVVSRETGAEPLQSMAPVRPHQHAGPGGHAVVEYGPERLPPGLPVEYWPGLAVGLGTGGSADGDGVHDVVGAPTPEPTAGQQLMQGLVLRRVAKRTF